MEEINARYMREIKDYKEKEEYVDLFCIFVKT